MAALSISTWVDSSKILEDFTSKPECFLVVQNDVAESIKKLTKHFYDTVKNIEAEKPKDALPELIIDNFDDEQIWQQLELQNEEKCNMLINKVSKLLAVKDKIIFPFQSDEPSSPELGEGGDSDELESGDSDSDQSQKEQIVKKKNKLKKKKKKFPQRESTIVDDKFFKLRDMEAYLEQEERENAGDSDSGDDSIDLFNEEQLDDKDEEDEEDAPSGPCYRDFFDPVEGEEEEVEESSSGSEKLGEEEEIDDDDEVFSDHENAEGMNSGKKAVKFAEASSSDDSDEEQETNKPKSSFETRQERLKQKIEQIHEEALAEKPWQLKGEVTATNRPQNSLLEEVLEFDMTSRPAPVITEQTTLKLEDIIKQRIKDKAWDDVERKVKPVDEPTEYKKKLVLDQEKSKLSLAQIYEKEYLKKQKEAKPGNGDDDEEGEKEEPPEHAEIRKLMHSLFSKLDALSNYHFTPRPPAPDVKVITNLPAITMEEVAPVATSDATLLAPEEVKGKPRGGLLAKEERSDTDKKRERRKKKKRQRAKKIDQETKQRTLEKSNPGATLKYTKQRAAKEIEKATKQGTIKKLEESSISHKAVKSSSAFFSQLQDEVSSLIKNKTQDLKRKKGKESQHSAKKLKL